MLSPAAVRRHGAGYGRHPAGTGPFRVTQWEPRRRVVLERNPRYWGPPARPRVVVFRPLTDAMTRVAELMAGGVDVVTELSPDNVALLRGDARFRVLEQTGPHLWFLILNLREGALRDRRVRQGAQLRGGQARPRRGGAAGHRHGGRPGRCRGPSAGPTTMPGTLSLRPPRARALLREAGSHRARRCG